MIEKLAVKTANFYSALKIVVYIIIFFWVATSENNTDVNEGRKRRNIVSLDTEIVSTTPQSSTTSPYEIGCKSAFGDYIKKHAVQIGGCALGLAVLQVKILDVSSFNVVFVYD